MERVGGVLRSAERTVLREVEVHLRRGFGTRRHLELDLHAVDRQPLARMGDVDRRSDQADRALRSGLPQAGADLTDRTRLEGCAVHVASPSQHGRPREDVLRNRMVHEPLRRNHLHLTGIDLLLGDDPLHATEVVGVGVRVDHRPHRPLTAVLRVERKRRSSGLGADQRVDHDHPAVGLDDAHHREVESTKLVDAGHDLEQAVLDQQLPLPPQARVRRVRRLRPPHELVRVEIPDHRTVAPHDLPLDRPTHESSRRVFKVLTINDRQTRSHLADRRLGRLRREPFAHPSLPKPWGWTHHPRDHQWSNGHTTHPPNHPGVIDPRPPGTTDQPPRSARSMISQRGSAGR